MLNNIGLAELILTGGWYIWWERRHLVHGEAIQNPHRSAMSIATLTTNYMMSSKITIRVRHGWKKPLEGKLMVNVDVDAAFHSIKVCRLALKKPKPQAKCGRRSGTHECTM